MTTAKMGAARTMTVGEHEIAFHDLGEGPAVLLVHGWPTSSHLWRDVAPAIAARNRVLVPDLPGFGGSSKPVDASYGFSFFEEAIDGLLAELEIDGVAVAGHDLGGPIAVHWALRNRERLTALALLNTLVYPEFSEAVDAFIKMASDPEASRMLTSDQGLEMALRLGLTEGFEPEPEQLTAIHAPFKTDDDRRALAKAGIGLEIEGFEEIAAELPALDVRVRLIYGEQDRILPDVAETMGRVKRDLPQAEVTSLPEAGHFLQEQEGTRVGELLAEFFAG